MSDRSSSNWLQDTPKAKPISIGGSASVITLKKAQKLLCKSTEEGRAGGGMGTRTKISLQAMVKAMVMQAVSMQAMEVHSGAEIHPAAHEGPHATAGGCALEEAVIT